ncbi:MAG: glycosyltransferase family 2 protein [Bacteroidia bacterium]
MPLFSVVIPLYNKESFITKTLGSALAQTFTDFEIIIVNDGSTDKGGDIVQTFKDVRIHYINTENRGVSAARNTGIKAAKGELIAFLDADDFWEPNHIEALYNLYIKYPEAGMYCSRYSIHIGNGALKKPVFKGISEDYYGIVESPFSASVNNRIAQTSAVCMPKNILEALGGFNENVTNMEDTELWTKLMLSAPVCITNTVTVVYNADVPQSLTKLSLSRQHLMDFNQFKNEEKLNKSLKAFIDIYRVEYALKYRIAGDIAHSKSLYSDIDGKNVAFKTKLLFSLPPLILRSMLRLKHWLQSKGIAVSVYN